MKRRGFIASVAAALALLVRRGRRAAADKDPSATGPREAGESAGPQPKTPWIGHY